MKKYLYLLIFVLFCFISACLQYEGIKSKQMEIIDSGKYYCIYKSNSTQVSYNIYDIGGKVILSEKTDRPIKINMINDNIVDIEIGMGSGVAVHKYYGVEQNLFSQDFSFVLSNQNELVAYMEVSKESPFENRKVIVRNIFDKNLFYKEFQLDFSKVDTPIIEAKFLKDGSTLKLTYLSGEDRTQSTTTLDLMGE